MTEMTKATKAGGIFAELHRRNVFRVALAYAGVAWIMLQVADVLIPALHLPEWLITVLAVACIMGFPIALILAWAYEWTSQGLVPDSDGANQGAIPLGGRGFDFVVIGLLTIAVAWFALDKFAGTGSGASASEPPTIAVLPFANLDADAARDYLSDGLTEELLNLLTRIDGLRVIGRTSAFQFRDRDEDLREIGAQLGADYLLEGTVRSDNDTIRVNARLVNAGNAVRIWADTFESELDDAFHLQELIARAVVAQLQIEFLEVTATPKDARAYDLYLRALRLNRIPGPRNTTLAIRQLQQALEMDPGLGPAWVELANAYVSSALTGAMTSADALASTRSAVENALSVDPGNADAYEVLAAAEISFSFDWEAAEEAYRRALELVPEHPGALGGAGALAAARGRLDEAIGYLLRSQRIDPLNLASIHNEAFFRYLRGDYAAAEAGFRKALEFAGDSYALGRTTLALTLVGQGKAQKALEETLTETAEPFRLAAQSVIYHHLGRTADANETLAQLVEKYGDRLAVPIAGSYAQRGEPDQAFAWLERAYRQKDPQLLWIKVHPLNKPLRDDARFADLLRRLNLD